MCEDVDCPWRPKRSIETVFSAKQVTPKSTRSVRVIEDYYKFYMIGVDAHKPGAKQPKPRRFLISRDIGDDFIGLLEELRIPAANLTALDCDTWLELALGRLRGGLKFRLQEPYDGWRPLADFVDMAFGIFDMACTHSNALGAGEKIAVQGLYSLAGIRFAESYEKILDGLERGTVLEFRREPDNEHDTNAVAVFTKSGEKVGYIPKTSNLWLASLLDDGAKAVPVVVEAIPGRRNPICKVIVFVSDRELRMREFICFR